MVSCPFARHRSRDRLDLHPEIPQPQRLVRPECRALTLPHHPPLLHDVVAIGQLQQGVDVLVRELIVMTVLGAAYLLLEGVLSDWTEHWQVVLGPLLLIG